MCRHVDINTFINFGLVLTDHSYFNNFFKHNDMLPDYIPLLWRKAEYPFFSIIFSNIHLAHVVVGKNLL